VIARSIAPLIGAAVTSVQSVSAASLLWFFFRTGMLVFGSGLVVVPFLKAYVVDQYHWLDQQQFLDSVAIGMMTPGPVVITASFVGYLLGGLGGALAATVGIFSPPLLFTVAGTPLLRRYRSNPYLQGFVRGLTIAVVGVLIGTSYLVGKTAIGDALTIVVGVAALAVGLFFRKIPDPLLVACGAVAGLIAYPILQPHWLLR
jgi:chromate transporter